MSSFTQPSREQLDAFREGDPIAIDQVISTVLPEITRWAITNKAYENVPQQEIESVINQVFAEICRNCDRYDPTKALFTTYAINLIRQRMIDQWQHESELLEFEGIDLELHENQIDGTYNNIEDQIDIDRLFEIATANLDDLEREFLGLMRAGEKSLETFTAVLQKHRHADNPEREVNTIKERVRRHLKAAAHEMKLDQNPD